MADFKEIVSQLATDQNNLQKRTKQLVAELDNISNSAEVGAYGAFTDAIERYNQPSILEIVSVTENIRSDKRFIGFISSMTNQLSTKSVNKIGQMQTRIFSEVHKSIAKAWNQNTADGFEVVININNSERKNLKSNPVDGLTVREWLQQFSGVLYNTLLKLATKQITNETGDSNGRLLLKKQIANAFATFEKSAKRIAEFAVIKASSIAYENGSAVFGNDEKWLSK